MDAPNTLPYQLPSDAVWFVTGCSSGIGQAVAQFIATTTSNRVVATARKLSALSDIPDADNVLKLQLDVTSIPSIEAALDSTLEKWGRVDVVVNNAGYSLSGEAEGTGEAEARAVMDTNFWGMVDLSKRAIGIMRDANPKNGQQGGVFLNVSSIGGWAGYPAQSFYHASKFAMEGWTEAVAKEMDSSWNIHFSIMEPGGVKTNYATSSMNHIKARHPAYSNPDSLINQMLGYLANDQNRSAWAEPRDLAAAMYTLVSRGQRLPIRLPLGPDAWFLLSSDLDSIKKDLDEFKDLSVSIGDAKQAESAAFLA